MDDFVLFWLILSLIVGFCGHIVWQWQLKRSALSMLRTQSNEKGRAAKTEQDADLKALLVEASMAFQSAKETGESLQTTAQRIVPGLIAKYPDVVAKHGKKLFKMFKDGGGFEGLVDLF